MELCLGNRVCVAATTPPPGSPSQPKPAAKPSTPNTPSTGGGSGGSSGTGTTTAYQNYLNSLNPFSPAGSVSGGGGGGPTNYVPSPGVPGSAQPSGGGFGPMSVLKFEKPKAIKRPVRPLLFYTSDEVVLRSAPYFQQIREQHAEQTQPVNNQSLAMDTLEKEAENDALISRREYENNLQMVNINQRLHAQIQQEYSKGAIPRQTFDESATRLAKSIAQAEESKSKWAEFEAEVAIDRLRLAQAQGTVIALSEIAKAYTNLWDARVSKAKSGRDEAQADSDYFASVLAMYQRLRPQNAVSLTELLQSQRDAEQSAIVLKLAEDLVDQNQKFYESSLENQRMAEQMEAQAAVNDPHPGTGT